VDGGAQQRLRWFFPPSFCLPFVQRLLADAIAKFATAQNRSMRAPELRVACEVADHEITVSVCHQLSVSFIVSLARNSHSVCAKAATDKWKQTVKNNAKSD
jgi:hypothetical protein